MFWITISFGGLLQECFTLIGEALFIEGTAAALQVIHAPIWVFIFLVNGLGHGITTLIAFIPIVATIFYTMDLLEQSGYMARAAFITDKLMSYLQLPGKAFIPLIISFGCNVPGILATRTLTSQRERLITGIMTPFMSCNARLAVFAVFASIFFPNDSLKVIMSLYFIGILVAIITGLIMAKFILPGKSERLIMNMPEYQMPKQKELLLSTFKKTQSFCLRVGKYILISSTIIGIFSQISVPQSNGYINIIELIGKSITPLFSAIGITATNWQATIALISGFFAKETTIITLDQLYSHSNNLSYVLPGEFPHYLANVFSDVVNIIYNALLPWKNVAVDSTNSIILHQQIKHNFGSEASAWSYLLFNLLYMPCISTIITFAKECGWKWAGLSTTWSFSIAYIIASLNYQFSQQSTHLITTIAFIIISIALNLALAKVIVRHTTIKTSQPL
jgi:ferrous iron transport protein B